MASPTAVTQSFAGLGVSTEIVDELRSAGITAPFPIQAATLPDSLAGRDVLGRGKTGSGKTLAFAIPMVDRLAGAKRVPGRPAGLILAPTRELATQIAATVTPLAQLRGLRVTTVFGGVPVNRQIRTLAQGVDIVVACPGRLEDLMKQRAVALDAVRITVLDEADHMADLGFLPGVTRILAATPTDGQRLLFSATLDNGVGKLVDRFLRAPVTHSVDDAAEAPPKMEHHVFEVAGAAVKKDIVRMLAAGSGRRILFMRTKHHARRLAGDLNRSGIAAVDLHGNLSQPARDRNLAAFAAGTARVMVATDIAARGIHVDELELVVHVDPPAEHKAYLHRSGRTARAGTEGTVVTLVLPEQRKDVAALLRKAGITATPRPVTVASPILGDLADGAPPAPLPAAAEQAPADTRSPRRTGTADRGGNRRQRGARTDVQGRPESSGRRSAGGRTRADGRPESATRRSRGARARTDGRPGDARISNDSGTDGRREHTPRGGEQHDRSGAAAHAGARGGGRRRGGSAGRTGNRVAHRAAGAPAATQSTTDRTTQPKTAATPETTRTRDARRPRRATRPAG